MTSGFMHVLLVWGLIAPTQYFIASAFQPSLHVSRTLQRTSCATNLNLVPEINDLVPEIQDSIQQLPLSIPSEASDIVSSGGGGEWRQYVSLALIAVVLIDILLGSPLANVALGPMRRASEKGATGDSEGDDDVGGNSRGAPILSAFGGKIGAVDRSKERVDSEAIAKAALDKALGTIELKRFLDENKTAEQSYDEVRKKIDRQMEDFD